MVFPAQGTTCCQPWGWHAMSGISGPHLFRWEENCIPPLPWLRAGSHTQPTQRHSGPQKAPPNNEHL